LKCNAPPWLPFTAFLPAAAWQSADSAIYTKVLGNYSKQIS